MASGCGCAGTLPRVWCGQPSKHGGSESYGNLPRPLRTPPPTSRPLFKHGTLPHTHVVCVGTEHVRALPLPREQYAPAHAPARLSESPNSQHTVNALSFPLSLPCPLTGLHALPERRHDAADLAGEHGGQGDDRAAAAGRAGRGEGGSCNALWVVAYWLCVHVRVYGVCVWGGGRGAGVHGTS